MKKTKWINSALLVSAYILTVILFYWFSKTTYFLGLDSWIKSNIVLYVVSLFLLKISGILWPPIPGGIITLASIPFLGWQLAFMIDMAGSTVGGIIAYKLGEKYGYPFLNKILDKNIVEKIKKIKIKKDKEIEAVFMYRILFGSIVLEAIYYGVGVLKVDFVRFLIGAISSQILVGMPLFFLASNIFSSGGIITTVILLIVGIIFLIKTKSRYFE